MVVFQPEDGLSDEAFINYITAKAEKAIATRRKHAEPLSGLANVFARALGPTVQDMVVYLKHRDKFDGLKISLGMSVDEVNDLFGDPIAMQECESGMRRLYGSTKEGYYLPHVLVEFTDGKARMVLSNGFIDVEEYFGPLR